MFGNCGVRERSRGLLNMCAMSESDTQIDDFARLPIGKSIRFLLSINHQILILKIKSRKFNLKFDLNKMHSRTQLLHNKINYNNTSQNLCDLIFLFFVSEHCVLIKIMTRNFLLFIRRSKFAFPYITEIAIIWEGQLVPALPIGGP